jgi:hypothetical protein
MKNFYFARTMLLQGLLLIFVVQLNAQIPGCTDVLATNYNPSASLNDGSCTYAAASVAPSNSEDLPSIVNENSGLILWNNSIWTHNDDTDIDLYELNPNDVNNYNSYELTGTTNVDWEEIAQDEDYVYVGDFGNNANGNRTDLKILRLEKNSLLQNNPVIDTIAFSYDLQTDFTPTGGNNTNFDCEAFVVSANQIYFFTKEWISGKTSLYTLPKQPGTHVATYQGELDVEGLITGSTYLEEEHLIVLSGYSLSLQPFLFLLYDFEGDDFFGGNKRKIGLNLPFHQIEGIATENGLDYYVSNEFFSQAGITIQAQLHEVDLSLFLGNYLENLSVSPVDESFERQVNLYPNPTQGELYVDLDFTETTAVRMLIYNAVGQKVSEFSIESNSTPLDVSNLGSGTYFYHIFSEGDASLMKAGKLIVQ